VFFPPRRSSVLFPRNHNPIRIRSTFFIFWISSSRDLSNLRPIIPIASLFNFFFFFFCSCYFFRVFFCCIFAICSFCLGWQINRRGRCRFVRTREDSSIFLFELELEIESAQKKRRGNLACEVSADEKGKKK